MSGNREKRRSWQSAEINSRVYYHYMALLKEICCNMFLWEGLPEEIDPRFLELTLYERALAVFFKDSTEIRAKGGSSSPAMLFNGDTDKFIAIQGAPAGQINMYHNPTRFLAYGPGGFTRTLEAEQCIPIWANFMREPLLNSIELYARRLADFDRTIDVNLRAQKTPIMITCPEEMRLTMVNFYKQYEGNEPVIFAAPATAVAIDEHAIQAIKTDAPYIIDKLLTDKARIWAEIMTFLGIDNANQEKRERLVANEVEANNGQIEMSRLRGLDARRYACKQINAKYGLDVSVNFNYDWISSNVRFQHDLERQSQINEIDDKGDDE